MFSFSEKLARVMKGQCLGSEQWVYGAQTSHHVLPSGVSAEYLDFCFPLLPESLVI